MKTLTETGAERKRVPTIDPEFAALIPPLAAEERGQLEANLLRDGCREPLVTWQGILLDGHNRLDICTKHGIAWQSTDVALASRDDAKVWIIRNQFGRRNLAPYQRAEMALTLEPLLAEQARERQGTRTDLEPCTNIGTRFERTQSELARLAGVSHGTIDKAKLIAAEAPEAVKEKLRRGESTINREYKALQQASRKAEQVKQVVESSLPTGKYHVIVSDPPWAYHNRPEDATHRAANPYPSMTLEAIKALPVVEHAHEDCLLWLWTTNAFMVQAHEVAAAWGFTVKTILTWAKDRMGTGDWLRGQTEHCLLAVRGRPPVILTNQTTLLVAPMREHSRKPDSFYALVESLCPGRKLDWFSRELRDGWDSCGAEVGKFNAC